MKEFPEDLAVMGTAELSEQRAIRDDKLVTLFQRWPALNRLELRQLREMHGERLRIARYVGPASDSRCEEARSVGRSVLRSLFGYYACFATLDDELVVACTGNRVLEGVVRVAHDHHELTRVGVRCLVLHWGHGDPLRALKPGAFTEDVERCRVPRDRLHPLFYPLVDLAEVRLIRRKSLFASRHGRTIARSAWDCHPGQRDA